VILNQRPFITPDQVKALLMQSADPIEGVSEICQGAGVIDLGAGYQDAFFMPTPWVVQDWPRATGLGTLEGARGSNHLEQNGVVLEGEQDIFGTPWDGVSWSQAAAAGVSWSGGDWNGVSWSGSSWSGVSWSGASWSGVSWSGVSWSGVSWSSVSWSDAFWTGKHWTGASWSSASWSSVSWSGDVWSGLSWN